MKNDLEGVEGDQLTYDGNIVTSGFTVEDIFEGTPSKTFSAKSQIRYNNFDYVFICWSDGVEYLSRSATMNETKTLTAIYKAHLGSSTLQATSSTNTGRRINSCKMLYSSNDMLWETKFQLLGGTWSLSREINLWQGAKNPSVDRLGNGFTCYEVDEGIIYDNIHQRRIFIGGDQIEFYSEHEGTPTISKNLVVWRDYDGLYCIPSYGKISNTNEQSQLPALAWQDDNYSYCLVYVEGTKILYRELDGPHVDLGPIVTLSDAVGNTNPSIDHTCQGTLTGIVWENTVSHTVFFRKKSSPNSAWGSTVEITDGTNHLSRPSIGIKTATIWHTYQGIRAITRWNCLVA